MVSEIDQGLNSTDKDAKITHFAWCEQVFLCTVLTGIHAQVSTGTGSCITHFVQIAVFGCNLLHINKCVLGKNN